MTTKKNEATQVAKPNLDALVTATLQHVALGKGKVSLAEAVAEVLSGEVKHVEAKAEAPVVIPITDEHRKALADIVDKYGRVAPSSPRLLNKTELHDVVAERDCIDVILGLLKTRKDTSIRETLANHLDKVAERDSLVGPDTPKDSRGHYQIKQEEPVPDTAVKVAKIISEPKPVISSAELLAAYESGDLTREEWLAITVQPEVPRVFSEEKARAAIKKNPGLLMKIAKATTAPAKTTTIKVSPNNG